MAGGTARTRVLATQPQRTAAEPARATAVERCTIVILNWNAPELTLRAARAVLNEGLPPGRLVLVDNGSTDDSARRLGTALPGAVLVRLPDNVSISRAYNAGAMALPGDAYALLNNDAFVHRPGSLVNMLRALRDPRVGVVVPRVLNEDLTVQRTVLAPNGPVTALVRASGLSGLVPDRLQPRLGPYWRHGESRRVWSADLPVVLFRGLAWSALGGFDERIAQFGEEQDIARRAGRLGWWMWFERDAEFVHLGSRLTRDLPARTDRAERMGRSEAAVVMEHLRPAAAAMTIRVTAAGCVARAAVREAIGQPRRAAELRAFARGFRSGWRLPAP